MNSDSSTSCASPNILEALRDVHLHYLSGDKWPTFHAMDVYIRGLGSQHVLNVGTLKVDNKLNQKYPGRKNRPLFVLIYKIITHKGLFQTILKIFGDKPRDLSITVLRAMSNLSTPTLVQRLTKVCDGDFAVDHLLRPEAVEERVSTEIAMATKALGLDNCQCWSFKSAEEAKKRQEEALRDEEAKKRDEGVRGDDKDEQDEDNVEGEDVEGEDVEGRDVDVEEEDVEEEDVEDEDVEDEDVERKDNGSIMPPPPRRGTRKRRRKVQYTGTPSPPRGVPPGARQTIGSPGKRY